MNRDETALVVNPERRKLEGAIKSKASQLSRKRAEFGSIVLEEPELDNSEIETYQRNKAALQEAMEK